MTGGAMSDRTRAADDAQTLAGITVLAALPPRELALLAVECEWRKVSQNEIVLNLAQGDKLEGVSFVVRGGVRLARSLGPAGRIAYIDVDAGGQFGEMAVFGVGEVDLTVIAREDGLIAQMPEARFVELLSREESVSRALLCQYARLLRAADTGARADNYPGRSAAEGTGAQRVYAELLALAEPQRDAGGEDCLFIARLPRHRELASRVDTTEEVVARAIAELVRLGIATRAYPGLRIGDQAAFKTLCEPH
ncbi:cyclic nucleotide-binding protein [Parvibaculum lavamentivorans DS-1]|uniref:Cyclic nucleotide-binding protein n=1 Tax=Parvibaculum lavamentivorans (strain DS-1 / DSM 13023 / NCIMB 13966) TaxID=402881 RepID=A7HPL9_PARL1|nr:Crp/Fnr family transcriptional regulator [Parvibaculum lavamentivorans]ABS61852.1 cyclic nucleotide-binding protein [Parvibaculum lavamentivorans DS-1]